MIIKNIQIKIDDKLNKNGYQELGAGPFLEGAGAQSRGSGKKVPDPQHCF